MTYFPTLRYRMLATQNLLCHSFYYYIIEIIVFSYYYRMLGTQNLLCHSFYYYIIIVIILYYYRMLATQNPLCAFPEIDPQPMEEQLAKKGSREPIVL